jgi:hypothetical protein
MIRSLIRDTDIREKISVYRMLSTRLYSFYILLRSYQNSSYKQIIQWKNKSVSHKFTKFTYKSLYLRDRNKKVQSE